jgi:hypothetical protein
LRFVEPGEEHHRSASSQEPAKTGGAFQNRLHLVN